MDKRPPTPAVPALTPREREVAVLLLRGEKRTAIAGALGIHTRTVDYYLLRLRWKLGAGSLVQLGGALRGF